MKGQQAHMHQNLLSAECASGEYRNAGDKKYARFRGHESAHKGVPASAWKLLLHICLLSIALFGLK